jgi:hypothetical protein
VVKKLNSERFARNPLLLALPQTFVLHQILRHISSSEFILDLFEIIDHLQERDGIHLKVHTLRSTVVETWDLHF